MIEKMLRDIYHLETPDFNQGAFTNTQNTSIIFSKTSHRYLHDVMF
jgi:hypothetical protein